MPQQNQEKNQHLKKMLTQLLRQLKAAKIEEAKWGGLALASEFEMLNEGIKALDSIRDTACDDFNWVKKLMETEHYFLMSDTLQGFHFPNYRYLINPNLLRHVTLEVQLDTLERKEWDLYHRGHTLAAVKARYVVNCLRHLNQCYFEAKTLTAADYKFSAVNIIQQSQGELEKHRGYKKILGNLILCILSGGTALMINKVCTGHFLFFNQTESAKQLAALSHTVTTFPSLN